MKLQKAQVILIFLLLTLNIFAGNTKKDIIYQYSTINALLEGVFDGELTLGELKKHGNIGIGTFNALDGEMVFLNGKFYQVKADGKIYNPGRLDKTPFTAVTFFETDKQIILNEVMSYENLKKLIDSSIPSNNIFYTIKITGEFNYVKTRSVPGQNKPYPKLVEVVKNQPVFEMHNIKGTIVGFKLPEFVNNINVPGYHLHFLSENKTSGGHLLEVQIKNAIVEIDFSQSLKLDLPASNEFHDAEISIDKKKELDKVEK